MAGGLLFVASGSPLAIHLVCARAIAATICRAPLHVAILALRTLRPVFSYVDKAGGQKYNWEPKILENYLVLFVMEIAVSLPIQTFLLPCLYSLYPRRSGGGWMEDACQWSCK